MRVVTIQFWPVYYLSVVTIDQPQLHSPTSYKCTHLTLNYIPVVVVTWTGYNYYYARSHVLQAATFSFQLRGLRARLMYICSWTAGGGGGVVGWGDEYRQPCLSFSPAPSKHTCWHENASFFSPYNYRCLRSPPVREERLAISRMSEQECSCR